MFPQMVGLGESLLADGAGVWPFACVRAHVLRQIAAVAKLVTAHDTRVAFLASVRDHVPLQSRRVDKRLGADGAHVRPFPGMYSHVLLQQVCPSVLLSTHLAGKWALAGMNQHVSPQNVRLLEFHATLGAGVVLVLGVVPLVLVEGLHILELLTADFARVRPVDLHVTFEDAWLLALHRTQLAGVDRLSFMILNCLRVPQ